MAANKGKQSTLVQPLHWCVVARRRLQACGKLAVRCCSIEAVWRHIACMKLGLFAVAKVGGMTLGVTVGCLLGMVPCLWLEPHARAQPCPA